MFTFSLFRTKYREFWITLVRVKCKKYKYRQSTHARLSHWLLVNFFLIEETIKSERNQRRLYMKIESYQFSSRVADTRHSTHNPIISKISPVLFCIVITHASFVIVIFCTWGTRSDILTAHWKAQRWNAGALNLSIEWRFRFSVMFKLDSVNCRSHSWRCCRLRRISHDDPGNRIRIDDKKSENEIPSHDAWYACKIPFTILTENVQLWILMDRNILLLLCSFRFFISYIFVFAYAQLCPSSALNWHANMVKPAPLILIFDGRSVLAQSGNNFYITCVQRVYLAQAYTPCEYTHPITWQRNSLFFFAGWSHLIDCVCVCVKCAFCTHAEASAWKRRHKISYNSHTDGDDDDGDVTRRRRQQWHKQKKH